MAPFTPRTISILMVDDDEDDAYIVKKLLEQDPAVGRCVVHVTSLEAYEKYSSAMPPDVVLLDLGLLESSGLGTLLAAKDIMRNAPIIILTGLDDTEYGEEAIRLGAQDYLPKSELTQPLLSRSIRFAIERFALTKELRSCSTKDPLTLLNNRMAFEQEMEKRLEAQQRYGGDFALFFIDLDKFKQVNDEYGHVVGDQVLRQIGEIFRMFLRKSDFVARIGGDEFVVIVPTFEQIGELEALAKEKIQLLKAPFPVTHQGQVIQLVVGASIGVAIARKDHPMTLQTLLESADEAMYRAKHHDEPGFAFAKQ